MEKKEKNSKVLAHILMIFLVFAWGFDYVPAKWGLDILSPFGLLFFKYIIGIVVIALIMFFKHKKLMFRAKDLPVFFFCALFGEVFYFASEYEAMDYMPVSLVTIILGFVPIISIISERIIYKRKANRKILISIVFCVIGVVMVIGADFSALLQGRALGYLFATAAMFCWNLYNFITASLARYDVYSLSFTQIACSLIITAPVALHQMPEASDFSTMVVLGIIWIGIINSGIGFLIYAYGLLNLGPTTAALYSDFLPVTTTFFGAIFLKESITLLQVFGGVIVIAAAFVAIKEKGKLDEMLSK